MRLRTITAAVFVAGGATLGLTGFASAETISPATGGGHAITCTVPRLDTVPAQPAAGLRLTRSIEAAPAHLLDAQPGWVVDDQGRTVARADWIVDDRGRVMVADRVVAERGWIVTRADEVVATTPGDCATTVVRSGMITQRVQERPSHHCTRGDG